jgi:hypothetical protein
MGIGSLAGEPHRVRWFIVANLFGGSGLENLKEAARSKNGQADECHDFTQFSITRNQVRGLRRNSRSQNQIIFGVTCNP